MISTASNPNLTTARLSLRPLLPADLEAFQTLHANAEVTRFLAPTRPLTSAESFRLFAQVLGHWQLREFGYWAVSSKDGPFMGVVGLWFPEGWPGVELGWRMAPEYWGQGYALEAAQRVLDFGFVNLELEEVISIIRSDNTRSLKLAERLEMNNYGTRTISDVDVVTYGIVRST